MSNELLFIISLIVDIIFIMLAARRGVNWLVGTIVVNLILVGVFGAKLINIGGFVTNAGNVFYGCVFLATHFILEEKNKKDGINTIYYGAGFAVFFTILAQLAIRNIGIPASQTISGALLTVFSFSFRITLASIIAYVFAQYINIYIYEWIKQKTNGRYLWLRMNIANILAQLVDSLLFFSIAFLDLSGPVLIQAVLAGWFIKTIVVFAGTPFLYLSKYLKNKNL